MIGATHRRFRRAVDSYVDGELDLSTTTRVVHHLAECDGCRRTAKTALAIKRSLRRLAIQEPSMLAAARLRRWADGLSARS